MKNKKSFIIELVKFYMNLIKSLSIEITLQGLMFLIKTFLDISFS